MLTKERTHFLHQTACDYDLDIDTVIDIWERTKDSLPSDFYEELEIELRLQSDA